MTSRRGFRKPLRTSFRKPAEPRRQASSWGHGHITLRDYAVLAVLFGFASAEDMRGHAERMQAEADERALHSPV